MAPRTKDWGNQGSGAGRNQGRVGRPTAKTREFGTFERFYTGMTNRWEIAHLNQSLGILRPLMLPGAIPTGVVVRS